MLCAYHTNREINMHRWRIKFVVKRINSISVVLIYIIKNQRIVRSVVLIAQIPTVGQFSKVVFDDNYRIFFIIISQLIDSYEHNKLKFYG